MAGVRLKCRRRAALRSLHPRLKTDMERLADGSLCSPRVRNQLLTLEPGNQRLLENR